VTPASADMSFNRSPGLARVLLAAMLLCLATAGCTNVGPDFVHTEAPLAESFRA